MINLANSSRFAAFAIFSFLIISCGGGGGGGGTTGGFDSSTGGGTVVAADTGTVTLLATDAETDEFKEINLTIVKAELLSDDGKETLFSGEKEFDLLQLAEVTEVFSVTEVPSGTYSKIRLTLTEIELVFKDGSDPVYPKLPGNGKLDLNPRGTFYVDSDNPLAIQLDFDAQKSIHAIATGSSKGKYNFRPVVFIKTVENEFDTKLIRQRGTVNNIDDQDDEFDLCLIEAEIQPLADDSPDCVHVNTTKAPASLFGDHADPISFGELDNGDIVTVVGRFFFGSDTVTPTVVASADSSDSDDNDSKGNNGNNESNNGKGNDKSSKDDDDESEDDDSDDDSSDDEFEDDNSDDESDDDDSSDDDNDHAKMVLVAEVIWRGNDITQSDNLACSDVTTDSDKGTWYKNFELPLPDNAQCEDLVSRPTILQPGSKIYDSEGNQVNKSSISQGVLNTVDGYTSSEDKSGDLKAVLVMLGLDDSVTLPEEGQLTGTIGVIDSPGSLTLITDDGDRCVNFGDRVTEVFETSQDADGNIIFSQRNVSNLESEQKANAFGMQNSEGCLEADTIIYEEEEAQVQPI